MEFLSRVLKGLVVGVANIIPGVSGGTMAVVMGIYDRLIGAVSDLRRDFKNSLLYLFPIGIGAVLGIVLFSHLIKFLLEGYPMPTNLFFLGLILGSIPMIFRRARKESFQKSSLLPFAVSFAVMLLMTIFQNVSDASSALITTLTPLTAIRLLLSAAVAAACMNTAVRSPSLVMVSFHRDISGSPGVRNRLNTTVRIKRNRIAFIPFIINLKGTWDSLIIPARNSAASRYPQKLFTTKREIIKITVAISFTLGSSRWTTDSV